MQRSTTSVRLQHPAQSLSNLIFSLDNTDPQSKIWGSVVFRRIQPEIMELKRDELDIFAIVRLRNLVHEL